MLAYTNYEGDNRVRRYAEALAKRGDHVDVISYAGSGVPLGVDEINGVTVFRIQRRDTNEHHMWTYAWRLLCFLWVSSAFLKRRQKKIKYDLIHVHNMPDVLAFAAWYPKWTGAKLILDIHDIMPELFLDKFKAGPNNWLVRGLRVAERSAAAFVDHVIVSNHIWSEKLITRSVPGEKCSVFLNHVDRTIFYRRQKTREDAKFIILFPGSFQWHQGLDIAIKAFALLKDKVPNAELHFYGGGPMETRLVNLVSQLGLKDRVKFLGFTSLEEIADVIANADLGIVPKRADSFGNEAYSTKIMEFMSQGVPVVASRTKIDTFYFDDTVVRFFRSGDEESMADAMLSVIQEPTLRAGLIRGGHEYVERNHWTLKEGDYLQLVDSLLTEVFDDENKVISALPTDKRIDPVHNVSKIT